MTNTIDFTKLIEALDRLSGRIDHFNFSSAAVDAATKGVGKTAVGSTSSSDENPVATVLRNIKLNVGGFKTSFGDLNKAGLIKDSAIDGFASKIGSSATAAAGLAEGLASLETGVGVVAGVIDGLNKLGDAANESQKQLTKAYYIGGGGGASYEQAMALSGFFGLSGSQMAQRANDLGDKLHSGGYGSAMLRNVGIVDFGHQTVNKFDNLIKALDALTKMSERDAIATARDLGISDLMDYKDLSPEVRERLKETMKGADSPEERRANADYRASQVIADNTLDKLNRTIGSGWNGVRELTYDFLANLLSPISWFRENGEKAGLAGRYQRGLHDDREREKKGLPRQTDEEFAKAHGFDREGRRIPKDKDKEHLDAQKDATAATKENTRALKDAQEFIGGGRRARGAVPAGWKLNQMDEALKSQAYKMGVYGP